MAKTSGLSNQPKILSHSDVLGIDNVPEILGKFCYVLESYPNTGFSLLLYRDSGNINFKFGTFDGTEIDVLNNTKYRNYIDKVFKKVGEYIRLLKLVNVSQLQLYFTIKNNKLFVIDARTHFNKFLGPGMVKDIIAKCGVPFVKVLSTEQIDQDIIDRLKSTGEQYVIRPSYPKMIVRDGILEPLQARI